MSSSRRGKGYGSGSHTVPVPNQSMAEIQRGGKPPSVREGAPQKRKGKRPWAWKDEHTHGEVGDSELHIGPLRLTVHRYHGLNPKQWFGTCYELRMECRPLGNPGIPLSEAKTIWLALVTEHVDELHELLHGHD